MDSHEENIKKNNISVILVTNHKKRLSPNPQLFGSNTSKGMRTLVFTNSW